MTLKTFAVGAASMFVIVSIVLSVGGPVQAAAPMHGWMMYDDTGSAQFDPDELPGEIVRDNGDRCDWWGYRLVHGRYVRYYHPCQHGDKSVDYSPSHRAEFQAAAPVQLTASGAEAVSLEQTEAQPAATEQAATVELETAMAKGGVVEASELAAMLTAIDAGELDDMLQQMGPFTVFAPTDAAVATLATESLTDLLEAPTGKTLQLLLSHVVPGKILSTDLTDGMQLETLGGDILTVTVDGDTIMVNDATIIEPNVEASVGVVHVIDAVLMSAAE